MPACAYCAADRPATKEHIWPRALIEKFEQLYTFNARTSKFFVGDAVVKDVCATCNNERLSPLDTYLGKLFDASFKRVLAPGESADLEYEYEWLARALLKISYNSARANKDLRIQLAHKQFSRFILQGGHSPRFSLRLQIVTSARAIDTETGDEDVLKPVQLRCATLNYDGPLAHRFLVRLVGVNSYWFILVLSHKPEPPYKWKEALEGLGRWRTPTGIPLSSSSRHIHVPVDLTTFMHPQLLGTLLEGKRPR
jgi:hypothetical protein